DDTIPIHLLTREAMQLYFDRLRPGGIVAIHITNRYLDLEPVVKAEAAALGKSTVLIANAEDPARGVQSANWAILSDAPLPDLAPYGHPPAGRPVPQWTDDFSNLFRALR